jgi:two-component system, NtrC family, sensor histidine kinase KinB
MLRTRLMSGLLCLLIILLAMGLYSINQCSELGKRIQKISRDHDPAGMNIQQMKRSDAAMTGALLALVTGDTVQSRKDFEAASKSFNEALSNLPEKNLTDGDEKALVKKIGDTFEAYSARAQKFLDVPTQSDAARSDAATLGQDTSKIFDLIDQFALSHERSLANSGQTSGEDINRTIRFLILLMIIAVAAFLAAFFGLSRGLLTPLHSLTNSIKLIGEGQLDQEVPVVSHDELGALAFSFNQMAAQLRQYQTSTSVELTRLNETIRATLASFPDPVFVLNAEGAVEFRNPAADQLAVKLLFAGVTRLPDKVDEKVEIVRASGEDYLPTAFQDAVKFSIDGQDRYFLPRVVTLRTEDKKSFGVAVILENVTRMLLLDDVKSNMIATVSHELKTPLTGVRMALYLLFEKTVGPLTDKQNELVTSAREEADRLLKTLNDLLDLAKLEQGTTPLQLKPVPPEELITNAERATREVLNGSHTLKTDLAPGLPDVSVDPQRIAYVFINLITNAAKYSPPGSEILVEAKLGLTRASKPAVRFAVKDPGPGITPEYQEHIFDRFYRIPGTNRTGAGLGLSIAREIVVAHQGEIGIISQPGHGSEFFFLLPLLVELK